MHTSIFRTWRRLVAVAALVLLLVVCAACGGAPQPAPADVSATATAVLPTTKPTVEAVSATAVLVAETPAAQDVEVVATATPTRTPAPEGAAAPPTAESPSGCAGLQGELEVQVLVGPAEAVGMEPVAVGSVPFIVDTDGPPYTVEGAAPVTYEATEGHDWGSYTVTLAMDLAVSGLCSGPQGSEQLDLQLAMTGEQHITVLVEGMTWDYPWEGSHTLDLAFPLMEGASAEGEGWVVVLHLTGS